ncbi:MAG: hypothetical protein VX834_12470, partial [Myxococcota bacterium]|nr:hypothetical protein [Myxococcota bacterium]
MGRHWIVALGCVCLTACTSTESGTAERDGLMYALTSDGLRSLLSSAQAGEVVHLDPAGSFEGTFRIPSGVSLDGHGATLVSFDSAGLVVEDVSGSVFVRNLTLESDMGGLVAYEGAGDGELTLESLTVTVARGFGIAIENLDVVVRGVTVQGPISGSDDPVLDQLGEQIDGSEHAILGFVAAFGTVTVEDLNVSGFGGFGAIFYQTAGIWRGGEVSHCVGVSVLVERSELEIESVLIRDGLAGRKIGFAMLSLGLVAADSTQLMTGRLRVETIRDIGVLQSASDTVHEDLQVREAGWFGLLAIPGEQSRGTLRVSGVAGSGIESARGAGLAALGLASVHLEALSVDNTKLRPSIGDGMDIYEVGDGLVFVGVSETLTLRDVEVVDNPRIGLLFDGGPGGIAPTFDIDGVWV